MIVLMIWLEVGSSVTFITWTKTVPFGLCKIELCDRVLSMSVVRLLHRVKFFERLRLPGLAPTSVPASAHGCRIWIGTATVQGSSYCSGSIQRNLSNDIVGR